MDNIINSLETEALHSEALKVYVRLLAANYACFFTVGLLNVSCIKKKLLLCLETNFLKEVTANCKTLY